jgi:hypothetical protein
MGKRHASGGKRELTFLAPYVVACTQHRGANGGAVLVGTLRSIGLGFIANQGSFLASSQTPLSAGPAQLCVRLAASLLPNSNT